MNTYTCASLLYGLTVSALTAVELKVDLATSNSILLENFNGGQDTASELRNGVVFESAQDGVGHYRVTGQPDPQILFRGYVNGVDFSSFPNVRLRHAFSEPNQSGSVFSIPSREGRMGKVLSSRALTGRQARLDRVPAQGEGVRIDPVDGASVAGVYSIDYLILDRGHTLGFEFDEKNSTRGGVNNFFIGHGLGGHNGKEIDYGVSDGLFHAVAKTTDPMMILQLSPTTGLAEIDTAVYQFIEIRMRVLDPQQGVASIYFRNHSMGKNMQKVDIRLINDVYFHTYLLDMRQDAMWNSGNVTHFRFDPTNQQQAFEIDHIRFYETAVTE